jgi:hypothetical protein
MLIRVHEFQPFASREGVDTVLGLTFRYDPALVGLLKAAIRSEGLRQGVKCPGGWLAEHRCWFVERPVWPAVREALARAGHAARGEEQGPAACPTRGWTPSWSATAAAGRRP